jgi:protein gp37
LQQFPQYQEVKDWDGTIAFVESAIAKPLKWKKPRKIFVCSMSDLFHENVTDGVRDRVFAVMALCPQHIFQVLTKRPENALRYFSSKERAGEIGLAAGKMAIEQKVRGIPTESDKILGEGESWSKFKGLPLPNVWMGVTVENQKMAEERISYLLKIPAAKRWLSIEPLLEEVDLTCCNYIHDWGEGSIGEEFFAAWNFLAPYEYDPEGKSIDWVVVGGESGNNARPCEIDWIESVVDQCKEEKVPVWVKQMGANSVCYEEPCPGPPGDRPIAKLENIPHYLRIRETPYW